MKGNNSIRFYMALFLLYNIVPLCLEMFYFSKDFYIFSGVIDYEDVILFYLVTIMVFGCCFYTNRSSRKIINFSNIATQLFHMLFVIFLVQLSLLVLFGIKARFSEGVTRNELLALQHIFLISGSSFIFLGAFVYATLFLNKKHFKLLVFVFILLDVIYMGKKFTFYAVAIWLFRIDFFSERDTKKPFLIAGALAVCFLSFIFIVRMVFSGDNGGNDAVFDVGLYAISSEFLGVYSSIGWAEIYAGLSEKIWDVDRDLARYYQSAIGHGLAIHPLAYFKFVFDDDTVWAIAYYFILLLLIIRVFSNFIGCFIYLIVSVNIMHFTRHGPDIFIKQVFLQSFFLLLIFSISEWYRKVKVN
ncbi:hypothetical protein [Vibrio vulnificus]|uniref:hypothetical protein n=1 Tax=Vibrio vulnificus TaxID=672 RepID=UPI001CDB4B5A|nr:hypothetical protein [Vibrio vulnificus]